METPAALHELQLSLLEHSRAPLSMLARSFGADDPAESLAAVRALNRRLQEGFDKPQALVECISSIQIFSLPFATQVALTDLALAGLPIEIPEAPADLAPELSCRYRAVEIASFPNRLSLSHISVLELRALEMIPVERAIDSGLWQRLAAHARPAVHERVLHWIDQALEHALLSSEDAARVILEIAHGSSEAITARALDLLAKPWALHLVCPPLQSFMKGEEVACAAVRVAEARYDRAWLRRFATDEHAARSVRSSALEALGAIGEATDMEIVVAMLDECPEKFGAAALSALLHCKRRGLSPNTEQAHVIVEVALRHEAFSLDMAAEITSSRADNLLSFLDELLRNAISKRRVAHLLGAWSTGKTLVRLFEMAQNANDPISSRAAIRELGRLEERSAEPMLLDQLAREPEECLFALGKVGGIATVQRLRAFMTDDAPAWIGIALETLFKLDPAPDVLAAAIEHGAISPHVLEALPAYASAGQTKTLADIALAPGHPYRSSAIGALGRTGGPLAIDPLAHLLTDGDENIRESAKKALAALGGRLALREASPIACLEQATDPGATLIAEAALRRLRGRTESTAETMLLLDAVQGNAHPQLVRVVRPYLARNNPEIRKRAIACLGVLGACCSAWVLPYLRPDEPLPVVRQALLALGRARVRGLGARFVPWLEHGNMNIKKTTAEILAHIEDSSVIKPLVDVLAWQDQPGLRTLCEQALQANAGKFVRSLVIEKLVKTDDPRKQEYLSSTLAGGFLAEGFAGLLVRRPEIPQVLVRKVIAAHAREAPLFDAAFRRRGIEARFPKETDVAAQDPLRVDLAQADMALWVAELRRYLREMAFSTIATSAWTSVLARVAETGQSWTKELSIEEQRILASRLPFVEDTVRRDIVALLAASTDPFVRSRIVPFVDVGGKVAPHVGPILAEVVRQGKPETARGFLDHGDDRVRAAAARVLLLSGSFEFPHDRVAERIEVIRAFVETGREAYLSTWILGQDAISLQEALTRIAGHSGKSAAWNFALKWAGHSPHDRRQYLVEVKFFGEAMVPRLMEFVREDSVGMLRQRALTELTRETGHLDREMLIGLLGDEHSGVSYVAAKTLVHQGNNEDRQRVLEAWLDGTLSGGFPLELTEEDEKFVADALDEARAESEELRLLEPISALPTRSRIPLLARLADSQHAKVAGMARQGLRNLPVAQVWPHVEARFRAGDLAMLERLGPSGSIPAILAKIAQQSETPEAWIRFAMRAAGQGLLYSGQLGETIAQWTLETQSSAAFALLARLTDWYDEGRARRLRTILEPLLEGERRDDVLQALISALRDAPPALMARILMGWVRPTDTLALRVLAQAEAASPGLVLLFDEPLRGAVRKTLETALETADPEAARKLMTYFVERAQSATEREYAISLLERHMHASSRRVKLHAHRLLRALAPKDRYLRATRILLEDKDPTTIRLAIRALAFGGDVESISRIAEALFHAHGAVARAAREGLLVMGGRAEAPLARIRGKLRPDRRAVIDELLVEIRQRSPASLEEA